MMRSFRFQFPHLFLLLACLAVSTLCIGLLAPRIGLGQSDDSLNTAFGPQLLALEMPAGQWPTTVPPTTGAACRHRGG